MEVGSENRKERRENNYFKKGGKLGQGLGALKRGAGTPLRTMIINIFKTKLLLNYYNVAQLSN